MEGSWLRAEIQKVEHTNLESASLQKILVKVFFIDWGFSIDIANVVKDVRLLPEDSQAKKVSGLAKKVEINGKLIDFEV